MFDLEKFSPENAEKFLKVALDGLELISSLIGGGLAGKAAGTLAAIRVIVDAIQGAYDGQISTKQVEEAFERLTKTLEANNPRADEALRKKFESGK